MADADAIGGLTFNYDNSYQSMRSAGYNVMRIPISWNNLEPVAPVWSTNLNSYVHSWNQNYLNDLKSMVTKARAAGLMVILDMHQDYWSPSLHHITNWNGAPGYCEGVGMPRWLDPSIDAKASTTQNLDFYNAMNWFYRNIQDPTSTITKATPWQLFSSAWSLLSYTFSSSSGFADYQAVVGSDILNEPYYSYVGGSPPAGQTVLQASGSRLAAFYNAMAPAITAYNPSWLLFFNDSTGGYNSANPLARETPTMTGKPTVAGDWVYAIHDYNFSYETFSDGVARHDDFGITLANIVLADAHAWGVPLYIGEFTIFTTFGVDARLLTDSDMAQTKAFLSWAKVNDVNWTFWAYVNPYLPMTVVDYTTNQAIPVVKNALATGLDSAVQRPTAAFTSSAAGLVASFDGSGSSDPGGTIASYSWNFGDGTPAATGVTASHTYAAAGTYQVTLTVTDNQSATGTITHPVTVSLPAGSPFITDTFGRTLASGWGNADAGGAWSGTTTALAVGGGSGKIKVAAAGSAPSVFLPATTATDADLTVSMSSDKVGTGNGVYLYAVGRRITTAGDYRLQTRLRADGLVGVSILRTSAAGAQTVIAPEVTVPAYTFVAGDLLNVRFQVTGTSPTTLRAKVWPATLTEPAAWLVTGTDSTAGLQAAGQVGFVSFLSGSGTNAPITTSFDNLNVRPTGAPPANQPPVASFTSSVVNMVGSFDGSASTDTDGTVASYSWNFGDGSAAGTGAKPSHTYVSAGTFQVTLTVTDNQGATGSVTHVVTVTAPNQPPVASFTSSAVNLAASFDGSASRDPDGTVASYGWNFGDGTPVTTGVSPNHAYAAAGTYQVTLTVTDNLGATGSVTK